MENEGGASTSIPNDDPDCHCSIAGDDEAVPDGAMSVSSGPLGREARVLLHLDCPHHGAAVRAITRGTLGGVSLGWS